MDAIKLRKPEPACIEYRGMRFLITYRPTDATMDRFIEELKKNDVCVVVRVCEPSYNTEQLNKQGIVVMDMPFEDGTFPSEEIISSWFKLLKEIFIKGSISSSPSSSSSSSCSSSPNNHNFTLNSKLFNTIPSTGSNNASSNPNITVSNGNTPSPTSATSTNVVASSSGSGLTNSSPTVAVHCVAGLGRAPVLVALALIELGMKYEDAVSLIREQRRGAINSKQLCYLEKYHPKFKLRTKYHNTKCLLM